MQRLNRTNANINENLPLKVMQFGGGNFLRAFVDQMIDVLNHQTDFNGGIVVIKPTEYGNYEALKTQEGLFTVILEGIKNEKLVSEKHLVSAVQKVVNPYTDWEDYLELAKNENIRFVVSNTTEAGIKFSENDGLDDAPPKEFPAKLTLWLHHRFQHFNGAKDKGCIFLPCELIADNGAVLKQTLLEYADSWGLSKDFKAWINTSNIFCGTLVDRIVSGFPKERAAAFEEDLGYQDTLLVVGEQYHSWVIQASEEVKKELPFDQTDLNVQFVDDLVPYREMKVRFLNGAHTALVPVAYLAGIRLVDEAMNDPVISKFIESLLNQETSITLDFPDAVKQQFVQDVLERFRNPTLKHKLISISLNSTSKFVARLLPTLKDFVQIEKRLPKRIVFGLSALIRFYKGEFNGDMIDVNDSPEVMELFNDAWALHDSNNDEYEDLITSILSQENIWGEDLGKIEGLATMVADNLKSIEKQGVIVSLKAIHN